jgi:hypothetical protein
MDASAQSSARAVHITPQTLALGNYRFDTDRVQAVRVWTLRPTRALWLLLLFGAAAVIHLLSGGFEDGKFSWSSVLDWMGIVLVVLLVIMVAQAIWIFVAGDNSPIYVLQVKTERGWTTAWATLDEARAEELAQSIRRAAQGQDVRLSLGRSLRHEGDLLQVGDKTYLLSQAKSALRRERQADRVAEIAHILIVAGFLCLALSLLVGNVTNHDPSVDWLEGILMVVYILFMIPGFAITIVWSVERKTRYVHLIELRGTFGRCNAYATLDQAEADAIVANINSAINAHKAS